MSIAMLYEALLKVSITIPYFDRAPQAKALVEDLLRLSVSEFPALAGTARTLFEETLGCIPRPFHRVLARTLFDIVNEADAHEKRVRGALKTMNLTDLRTVVRWILAGAHCGCSIGV